MSMTYTIETWGCQMNHHDSERLAGAFERAGFRAVDDPRQAGIVVLNTCSVREKPVQKLLSRIGELANLAHGPRIGVCGCVAQQEGEELLARTKAIAFVLGPGQIHRLPEALDAIARDRRVVLTGFDAAAEHNAGAIFRTSSTRGMITVIEGCNEYCTFCVVPYTRGPEISRPLKDVVQEARGLAATGLKEIELLGQTINAYRCPVSGAGFADLLEEIATIEGPSRIRFITSHPRLFDDRLIDVLARHPKVSRYLHLPFQSGSDRILARMRRRYTRSEYLDLVQRIRRAVPDINLSADVIVGFPGESEEDFAETLSLLEEVRFGQVFAFAYSPRPRTPAARYDDQLPDETKKRRLAALFERTDAIATELNQRLVGSVLPVLIDGESRRSASDWQGRSEDNRVVNFPKTGDFGVGEIVNVRIVRAGAHSLYGRCAEAVPARLPLAETVPAARPENDAP